MPEPTCKSCKHPLYIGAGTQPPVCDNPDCPECDDRFLDKTEPGVKKKPMRTPLKWVLTPYGYTVMGGDPIP